MELKHNKLKWSKQLKIVLIAPNGIETPGRMEECCETDGINRTQWN